MPYHSKKGPNMPTSPPMTMKASSTMSSSGQKCGQKQGTGDLFGDMVRLEPAGNSGQAHQPAKKGRPSLKPDEQAASQPVPHPVGKGS